MAEVTSAPPTVELDPQDPLPESNWEFRRAFVFVLSATEVLATACIIFLLYRIAKMMFEARGLAQLLAIAEMLYKIGLWVIGVSVVDRVLYLIAPSAEQATKMLATARMALGGVGIRTTQTAVSTPGQSTGTTTTTVGATDAKPASPLPPSPSGGPVAASTGASTAGGGIAAIPDLPPSQRPGN